MSDDLEEAEFEDGGFEDDGFDGPGPGHSPDGERLQKVLARLGIGSRRVCENMISVGRITVDGEIATLGQRIDVDTARVEVDGAPVPVRPDLVYRLLHKPAGHVSTASDPQGRPIVVDLVPDTPRVVPVGRLDLDTEGLLLLTNDGDLTHRMTHPSFGVEKEYLAHVETPMTAHALRQLRHGIELDDGPTAPAKVSQPQPGLVKLVIHEGRNRQVRRMCDAVGHPVVRLVRTRIGPLVDPKLVAGAWRELEYTEVRALYAASGAEAPTNGSGRPPKRRYDSSP